MKVLQVNCVYKKGSTGKIVQDLHACLQSNEYESLVCYGRGEKIHEENVYKSCGEVYAKANNLFSRLTGIMYGGCFFSTSKLIRIIKKEKPDVVHLHCINGYFVNIYRLITYLKKNKIKTVLTLHAEFMHTANCGHSMDCEKWKIGCGHCPRLREETKSLFFDNTSLSWKKMRQAFEGFNCLIVASVSPWLQERAQSSPILKNQKHVTVLNGIDTSIFHQYDSNALRRENGFENKKIVFHVTAGFSANKEHKKGGYYVLEIARRCLEIDNNIQFVIAGNHEELNDVPSNVVFLGNITEQIRLAKYYSMADVTLLTSKRETFSMVVAESLCCGTPVVGFEAGAPEMITIKECSSFVPYGDVDKLFNELNVYLSDWSYDKGTIAYAASLKYSKELMMNRYQALYNELVAECEG